MQSIAAEFNYSETTFVLPPWARTHTAHVRIFTPRTEVRFAGHPNVGTGFVLARDLEAKGSPALDRLLFEEAAGLVPIRILRDGDTVVGAELTAPEALEVGPSVSATDIAACLSLDAADIKLNNHAPQVLSVGLPFLIAELTSKDAVRRAKPNTLIHEQVLPPVGTDAIFAYALGANPEELHARMFSRRSMASRKTPRPAAPPPRQSRIWPPFEANATVRLPGAFSKALRWAGRVCFWGGPRSAMGLSRPCTLEGQPCKSCPDSLMCPRPNVARLRAPPCPSIKRQRRAPARPASRAACVDRLPPTPLCVLRVSPSPTTVLLPRYARVPQASSGSTAIHHPLHRAPHPPSIHC
jgi:Phenazine biosynthesis-like protein